MYIGITHIYIYMHIIIYSGILISVCAAFARIRRPCKSPQYLLTLQAKMPVSANLRYSPQNLHTQIARTNIKSSLAKCPYHYSKLCIYIYIYIYTLGRPLVNTTSFLFSPVRASGASCCFLLLRMFSLVYRLLLLLVCLLACIVFMCVSCFVVHAPREGESSRAPPRPAPLPACSAARLRQHYIILHYMLDCITLYHIILYYAIYHISYIIHHIYIYIYIYVFQTKRARTQVLLQAQKSHVCGSGTFGAILVNMNIPGGCMAGGSG